MLQFDKTATFYIVPQEKDETTFSKWIGRFAKFAAAGFTASDALGGWLGEDGKFVTEKIVRFTVWNPTASALEGLFNTLNDLRVEENQEAVSIEIDRQPFVCFDEADIEELKSKVL
jgi:hypothetical protein